MLTLPQTFFVAWAKAFRVLFSKVPNSQNFKGIEVRKDTDRAPNGIFKSTMAPNSHGYLGAFENSTKSLSASLGN